MLVGNHVNFRQIYTQTFKLYNLKWKYDPNLSVQKIYAYYANEKQFEAARKYIECLQEAHQTLME